MSRIYLWRVYRYGRNTLTTESDHGSWDDIEAAILADQGSLPEWDVSVNGGGKVTRFTPPVPYREGTLSYVAEVRD